MAKLKLPTYEKIESMTSKEISAELKRLRPLATSRIKRIKDAGKEGYLRNLGATFREGQSKKSLLANVVQLLRKPFSKLSNINKFEKDMLKTLHSKGYKVKSEDITLFNEFMGEVRAMYKGRRIPDSTRVAEAFIQAQRLKMSKRALMTNLDYWREHLEDLQSLKSSDAKTKYSANYIKSRINKIK